MLRLYYPRWLMASSVASAICAQECRHSRNLPHLPMSQLDKQSLFCEFARLFSGSSRQEDITIGVEQEFFLCRPCGYVCDHHDSQRFLASFAQCGGELTEEDDPGIGRHIASADLFQRNYRLRVKYDHHPHLMELELPPVATIGQMVSLLAFAMDAARRQAADLGLVARFEPFLPEPVDDAAIWSEHSLCEALRSYRRRVNADRPEVLADPRLMNFSAYITATHLHLGGIGWESLGPLLDGLYRMEPDVVPYAWKTIAGRGPDWPRLRWQGYIGCLGHLPLVAFPDLPAWTPDTWFDALCSMPLADTADNHRGGGVDTHDPLSLFKAKRDLCLIKPRAYGTVEFRADPCQPTAEDVADLCAMRLGLAVEILDGYCPDRSFGAARADWQTQLDQRRDDLSDKVQQLAITGLRKRGRQEETFLSTHGEESDVSCASCRSPGCAHN